MARDATRSLIDMVRNSQKKERIYREVFQTYAKAALVALRSHNEEDARLCLEQMHELTMRRKGYWKNGWDINSGFHSLRGGVVRSRITWKQITESDKSLTQRIFSPVQEESQRRKALSSEKKEVPMPIEVKLHRGEISFRHPDSECWIRGKRLGDAYTIKKLGVMPVHFAPQYHKQENLKHTR